MHLITRKIRYVIIDPPLFEDFLVLLSHAMFYYMCIMKKLIKQGWMWSYTCQYPRYICVVYVVKASEICLIVCISHAQC